MATPLSYSAVTAWVNHSDPRNIPPSVRIIAAEDILRWENSHKELTQRSNEHDSLIENQTTAISTLAGQVAALETENESQATLIQNLTSDLALKAQQIAALTRSLVVRSATTTYTMLVTNRIHIHTGGSATYNLPDPTTSSGVDFVVYNRGTGTLTLAAGTNQVFLGGVTGISTTLPSNQTLWCVSDGTQWVFIMSDDTATL